jgi:hypothetical protein
VINRKCLSFLLCFNDREGFRELTDDRPALRSFVPPLKILDREEGSGEHNNKLNQWFATISNILTAAFIV